MKEQSLYVYPPISNKSFPVYIDLQTYSNTKELFRTHWHEHFELIYMVKGELLLTCNAVTHKAKVGDLLILNPNDVHHLESITPDVDYYCILFDPTFLKSGVSDITDVTYITPIIANRILFQNKIDASSDIISTIRQIISTYQQKAVAYDLIIKGQLFQLIAKLISKDTYHVLTQHKQTKRQKHLYLIQQIVDHIHKQYKQDMNYQDIASMFNVSYHHMLHIFKEYTGKTMVEYINALRIEKACQLLRSTDDTITTIATIVGYNDPNYFTRLFKKVKGHSPKKYKKEAITYIAS